jgi:hypothetical protein
MGHYHRRLGSTPTAQALNKRSCIEWWPNRIEAIMRHLTTTITGHHGTRDVEAAVFWIFAGIIMVIAFGDALAVLAIAVAILIAISWIYGKVEHRLERNDAEMAPVTHLHPELIGQRDLKRTSADPTRHGPRAA